jgi:hypothetical protein
MTVACTFLCPCDESVGDIPAAGAGTWNTSPGCKF